MVDPSLWVQQVLYLPCAMQLSHGGFFARREEGAWDTPESAKLVLHGLVSHHKEWLQRLQTADGSASLAELASRGLADAPGGDVATQMALDVTAALYAQDQVQGYDTGLEPLSVSAIENAGILLSAGAGSTLLR